MSGFVTPDVSSGGGYASGGGLMGFLTQGLQGFQAAHAGKVAEKQQGIENKQKTREADEKQKMDESTIQHQGIENTALQAGLAKDAKAEQMSTAQTTVDNIRRQALIHPDLLKDPSVRENYIKQSNLLGIPVVLGKDGSIDTDAIKAKQFSDLTEEQKQYYAGLDPNSRKAQMRDIGGVDAGFMSANPVHSYKEETERKKADTGQQNADTRRQYDLHKEHVDDVKLPTWQRLNGAKAALVEATTSEQKGYMQAKIVGLYAQANKARVEASAVGPRLALMQRSLDDRGKEIDLQIARLQYDTSPNSLKNVMGFTKELDGYVEKTQGQLDSAEKTLEAYAATQTDGVIQPENQMGIQLQSNVHRLNDSLAALKQKQKRAQSMVQGYEPQGMAITQHSGKQSNILPRKASGSNPQEGSKSMSKSGKPMTYTNGKWNYD